MIPNIIVLCSQYPVDLLGPQPLADGQLVLSGKISVLQRKAQMWILLDVDLI